MNLKDWIQEARNTASILEDDASTLINIADALEYIKDTIEGALDFYELKDGLEELTSFNDSPHDLIIPDINGELCKTFDLSKWENEYAQKVQVREPKIIIKPKQKEET